MLGRSPPTKSELHPPKQAPSTWQVFFADWLEEHRTRNPRRLNVAQAAKEAGQVYHNLKPDQREKLKSRALAAKEDREREMLEWKRRLTPDDIRRENVFRAAQRKAGKSRRGNLKDPNAPKKPLSAYFMFLQYIRANMALVQEVFGDETETTKQSVLAAAKWRSLSDDEKKVRAHILSSVRAPAHGQCHTSLAPVPLSIPRHSPANKTLILGSTPDTCVA
ncbi:hypothetical protein BKA62DRAFT_705927 [Auriculariales sp. MPI-PUGE-AT-0066]|nr:hypothetical protein BKA62DRAFT_705927 [Auriculariales sp. MPI-PUGE-AT-0066]